MGLNIGRHLSIHFAAVLGTMFLFGTVVRSGSRSAQFPGSFPGVNRELFQGFMACSRGILIQGQQALAEGSNGQAVRGENAFEKSIVINLDENKKTNIRILLLGTITPCLVHPRTVGSFVFFWRKADPTALSHTDPQPQSRSTCYEMTRTTNFRTSKKFHPNPSILFAHIIPDLDQASPVCIPLPSVLSAPVAKVLLSANPF